MATGKEIKQVFDAMEQICRESAALIKATNDMFVARGFQPSGGNAVMWDRSSSYLSPDLWLPYFQQRVFIRMRKVYRAVGINIMFDNGANTIPYISCGLIVRRDKNQVYASNEFFNAGWNREAETKSILRVTAKVYRSEFSEKSAFDHVINYFLPLDVIRDLATLQRLVVDPLVLLHSGADIEEVAQKVSEVAITVEEINE